MTADRNTNETIQKTTEAGRDALREASRTAQLTTGDTARAAEQGSRAAADIVRQSLDTAHENLQTGLNTAAQTFQRAADQFGQVLGFSDPRSDELSRKSSQNIEAVSQAGMVIANGVRDISQEWFDSVQTRVTKNLDAWNRITGCRSVQDLVAVQSELVRDNLRLMIDSTRRVAELSIRVANEAAGSIQPQADRTTTEVERTPNTARRVA